MGRSPQRQVVYRPACGAGPMSAPSRDRDEQIINFCRWRACGWSFKEIGDAHGVTKNATISAVRKVIAADVAESGEPEARVRAAYEQDMEQV